MKLTMISAQIMSSSKPDLRDFGNTRAEIRFNLALVFVSFITDHLLLFLSALSLISFNFRSFLRIFIYWKLFFFDKFRFKMLECERCIFGFWIQVGLYQRHVRAPAGHDLQLRPISSAARAGHSSAWQEFQNHYN